MYDDETLGGWISENLRIIISIIIVIMIAAGIYSYSKRVDTESPTSTVNQEESYCQQFGDKTSDEIPMKCLKYFN